MLIKKIKRRVDLVLIFAKGDAGVRLLTIVVCVKGFRVIIGATKARKMPLPPTVLLPS